MLLAIIKSPRKPFQQSPPKSRVKLFSIPHLLLYNEIIANITRKLGIPLFFFFCWPTQPTFPRALSLSLPRIPFNLFNRKSFAPGQQPTSTGTVLCAAKMKDAVFLSHLKLKVEATRSEIGGTNSSSNSHKHTLSKNVATITKCQSGQIPGKKSMRKSEADERVFPLHQMQRQGRGPPPTIGTKLITSPKLVPGRV